MGNRFLRSKKLSEHSDRRITSWLYQKQVNLPLSLTVHQNSTFDRSNQGFFDMGNQFLGSKQLSEHSDQRITSWLYQKVGQLAYSSETIRIQHMICQTRGFSVREINFWGQNGSQSTLTSALLAGYTKKQFNLHLSLTAHQNSTYDRSNQRFLDMGNQFWGSKQLSEHSDQHITSRLYQKVGQLANSLETIRIQHMIYQTRGFRVWEINFWGQNGSQSTLTSALLAGYTKKQVNLHLSLTVYQYSIYDRSNQGFLDMGNQFLGSKQLSEHS